MFIESLKYGLHLHGNLCVHQLLMLHIIYMHIFALLQPRPPSTTFRTVYLFVTAVNCSLFSHIICNNLHLHILQLQHAIPRMQRGECEEGAKGNGVVPRLGLVNANGKELKLPQ